MSLCTYNNRYVDEKSAKQIARFVVDLPRTVSNPVLSLNVKLDSTCYGFTVRDSTGREYKSQLNFDNVDDKHSMNQYHMYAARTLHHHLEIGQQI